jgi:hypothetical protein
MRSIAVIPTAIHLDRRSTIGLLLAGVAAGAVGLAAMTYSPPWATEGDRPATPPAATAERTATLAPAPQPAFALSPEELTAGYAQAAADIAGQVGAEPTAALAPAPQPAFALSPEELTGGYAQAAAERTAAGAATDLP